METVNGAPQFEPSDMTFSHNGAFECMEITTANMKLIKWAESRRCVRCENLQPENKITIGIAHRYCNFLSTELAEPQEFSCAAFSPQRTQREEK